ncbi:MAG: OB-fold nucleic acid binding domain-containing protein [Chloroflexota bacterium]|nr:OB-fold nucleic acid binding domain-containing protein [Chloroflexota bacterium]
MARLKEEFVAGGRFRGYADGVIDRAWEMIQGFALYGFPESHAVAFALLIAVSGYLKHYYPAQFLCSLLNAQPMGFYSPAMLISDAERHKVVVLPPDIQSSGHDHRMERTGDGTWAVRLGLRIVAGVGRNEKDRIEAESRRVPYADLHDVIRRLPLGRDVLTNFAAVGAFAPLGLSRREAMWAVGVVDGRTDLLPAVLPEIPALPPLTDEEEVRLDYALLGCAPGGRHLMNFYRSLMDEWGVVCAKELASVPHGALVKVGGIVAIRQRPGTAKGVAFLTIEDETGTANIVVMPDVFQRERTALRLATLLAIKGKVERVDGVINVRAEHVRAFGEDKEAGTIVSKQFA